MKITSREPAVVHSHFLVGATLPSGCD